VIDVYEANIVGERLGFWQEARMMVGFGKKKKAEHVE